MEWGKIDKKRMGKNKYITGKMYTMGKIYIHGEII